MTIGYGYLSNTAMCAEYHKGMTVIDWLKPHPNFFNLSPIPRFNAGSMSEAPVGSCECIFEANKYQFLDSDLHYGLPHLSKELKISFSNPRNTIPRVLLSPCNGGTKELNITMFCNKEWKADEIIEWSEWKIQNWPQIGDKPKTIKDFKEASQLSF
ncbi:hypothetical protein LENED_010655 [Lentinula edodes]|uniref:Uncharacterized protein n=1 Tax=Lentinula edodes TaxID=5353 RepID=A0A1Q3EMZ5_LENED|nr:hypothetical protein LENED_010655 [Lentinula edodes]